MNDPSLNPQEKERYSRHLNIPGFDESAQIRLKNSSVLIVGVGGLGSPAALYLAAAGVGTLGIADFDRVERHNLQRQVLYVESDVGKLKAEVAKARLQALHPGLTVPIHGEGILRSNATEILSRYDVIVDGTDNFGTRYLLNDASYLCGKPLVSGSVFRMEGQVIVFGIGESEPCYRCLFPEPPTAGTVPNCNEAGVVGAICGMVGSMQAMEVIKLLTGLGKPLTGTLLKIDCFGNRFSPIKVAKDGQCSLCGQESRIHDLNSERYLIPCELQPMENPANSNETPSELGMEIDVNTAKQLMQEKNALMLDIREADEAAICQIKDSTFVAMGDIPERLDVLPKDRPIIAYCHHGFRSLRVALYLRSAGFPNCTSMTGGINRWANEIEPNMAKY